MRSSCDRIWAAERVFTHTIESGAAPHVQESQASGLFLVIFLRVPPRLDVGALLVARCGFSTRRGIISRGLLLEKRQNLVNRVSPAHTATHQGILFL